eukprot:6182869-Pleurochrysis_carterae.AAC.6
MAEASVRVEERLALSLPKRAAVVAAACGADMVINFPLWISAKRIAAGLPLPRAAEVYKGSGTLYFAMGPMTIVEDGATSIASRCLSDKLSSPATLLVSSCLAGGAGALVIGAQTYCRRPSLQLQAEQLNSTATMVNAVYVCNRIRPK